MFTRSSERPSSSNQPRNQLTSRQKLATPTSTRKSLRIQNLTRKLREGEWAQEKEEEQDRKTLREFHRRSLAAKAISKWWKAVSRYVCVNQVEEKGERGYIRRQGKNVVCSITCDKIKSEEVFKFITSTGQVIAYSAVDLVKYLTSTGNFKCPCSTSVFSLTVIRRLEQKAIKLNECTEGELVSIYNSRYSIIQREIENRNRYLAIESSCGLILTEALHTCSNTDLPTSDAINEIECFLMPEYRTLVNHFYSMNPGACRAMLLADREKLRRLERVDADPHAAMLLIVETVEDLIENHSHLTTQRRRVNTLLENILPRRIPVPHFFISQPSAFVNRREEQNIGFFSALDILRNNGTTIRTNETRNSVSPTGVRETDLFRFLLDNLREE